MRYVEKITSVGVGHEWDIEGEPRVSFLISGYKADGSATDGYTAILEARAADDGNWYPINKLTPEAVDREWGSTSSKVYQMRLNVLSITSDASEVRFNFIAG